MSKIFSCDEEFYLVLKSFNGVPRKFQECLKFKGCFKEVSMMFKVSSKGVYKKFQGCFKEISKVFQERFQGVSRKI